MAVLSEPGGIELVMVSDRDASWTARLRKAPPPRLQGSIVTKPFVCLISHLDSLASWPFSFQSSIFI